MCTVILKYVLYCSLGDLMHTVYFVWSTLDLCRLFLYCNVVYTEPTSIQFGLGYDLTH